MRQKNILIRKCRYDKIWFFFYWIKSDEDIKEPLDISTRSAPPRDSNPLRPTHIIYIGKKGRNQCCQTVF